ncbi:MAG: hypothetical protein GY761_04890 [Hyphomicrobiales bacterium]|nr:hypothetical protein [Hyphomicrobiales bacterium]
MSSNKGRFADVAKQLIALNTVNDKEIADKSSMVIFNDTVRTYPFSEQGR